MKPIFVLAFNDLRNAFRDKVLLILLLLPFLLFPAFRFGLPVVAEFLPLVADYFLLILGFFCILVAILPAFLLSFMMLEEKDDNVLVALRVLPLSPFAYLTSRMGFTVLLSFGFALVSMLFSGLIDIGLVPSLGLAFQICLTGPIVTLSVVALARNKIEGLSVLKGLMFVFMVPMAVFFVDATWVHALCVFPPYWTYQAFKALDSGSLLWFFIAMGLGFHLFLIQLSYGQFRKRVF